LNTIDIIILIPLIYGTYRGFKKGFLMELATILAFVLAIIGGFKLLHWGMNLLDQHFDINGNILPYLAFILIFIGIVLLVNLIGKALKTVLDMTLLGSVDSLAGAIVGLLKWTFGVSVILWLTTNVGLLIPTAYINESQLYPYIVNIAPTVVEYVAILWPMAEDIFHPIKELV
jgi:membrane protein required for colicin V production